MGSLSLFFLFTAYNMTMQAVTHQMTRFSSCLYYLFIFTKVMRGHEKKNRCDEEFLCRECALTGSPNVGCSTQSLFMNFS
uniref:Putative secreted protein synganglion overexpressed n=1 Tax=Rhipicephalus microplus TaxID=6941 RepID=A0A6M2DBR7_RHIMP